LKPIDIRIELLRKGFTNRRFAARIGRAERTVSNVIYGHGYSAYIAGEISKLTGIPVRKLFPERAAASGGRKSAITSSAKNKRAAGQRH